MGLLDALLGNASEIDPQKVQGEFAQIMAPGEKIEKAYGLIRDLFVFTDKHPFQHRDRGSFRSRRRAENLGIGTVRAVHEGIQQAVEHLPSSAGPGHVRK
jgi:hypothetical protein